MPAFNAAPFIEKAIRSIQSQSVDAWKLIVVDDGSTDDTAKIVRGLANEDPRISVVSNPTPSGSAYTPRKIAVQMAQTEWVAPLDADDWIEQDYLEKLIDVRQKTGADVVYPLMYVPEGETERLLFPIDRGLLERVHRGRDCVCLTLNGWKIQCNGGLIRKHIFEESFPETDNARITVYTDELLTRVILWHAAKVAFSDAKYFYRYNADSVTKKFSLSQFGFLYNNGRIIDFVEQSFGVGSTEYALANCQAFFSLFSAMRLLNSHSSEIADKEAVRREIASLKDKVDREAIKKIAGWKYPMLLKLGIRGAEKALGIIDKLS